MDKKRAKDSTESTTEKRDGERSTGGSRPGSATSSVASGSASVSREATPAPLGPMPKHQYSKDHLMKLRETTLSQSRPPCLNKEHDSPEGMWDPERWFRSFDTSRGSSPLAFAGQHDRDRKRPSDLDRDSLYKRRSSANPKGKNKDEEEDVGIVLGPQRRSFGGGCHVVTAPTSQRARPGSPQDNDRDNRERRGDAHPGHPRRIGSGRIQIGERHDSIHEGGRDRDIDHVREREPYRDRDRGDRDRDRERDRDPRDPRDRDPRDQRDRDPRDPRDRDPRDPRDRDPRDQRDPRGRYDRDNRRDDRYDRSSMDRYGRDMRDRDGRNDYRDRRYDGRRSYHRGGSREAEPEWFTGGPSSQHDTIELHGFEGPHREDKTSEPEVSRRKVEKEPEPRPRSRTGSLNVADRNGSLETNESSSPEASQHSDPDDSRASVAAPPKQENFDFSDFFKMSNIPGLGNMSMEAPEPQIEAPVMGGGSRFSQWFNPQAAGASGQSQGNSGNNSRRNSINEEFSYLNDLVGGQKSPVIPSPPMNSHTFFSPITTPEEKQQHHLLEMLHNAKVNVQPLLNDGIPQQNYSAENQGPGGARQVEANLKALLMGAGRSQAGHPNKPNIPQLAVPHGKKMLTAEELEASMGAKSNAKSSHQPSNKGMPMHPPGLRDTSHYGPRDDAKHSLSFTSAPVIPTGKITTVAELEADFKDVKLKDMPGGGKLPAQLSNHSAQAALQAKLLQAASEQQKTSTPDMGAYNRLLAMIQKATETPKTEGRPPSPNTIVAQAQKDAVIKHQNDLVQKLLQQQRQQAQVNLQQQAQAAKLQQQLKQVGQLQQQQQLQELLKMMKNTPAIIKPPPSPVPPQMTLQPPASPRCPSPVPPQNLLQQPPPSPRAPSPIMFGSQPPMHLTAPAPIHANQLTPPSPTQTLSPNTLQVGVGTGSSSPVMQRVPSPAELRVHTQAIMQNALIKKQLEDQKERFLKRQADTVPGVPGSNPLIMTSLPMSLGNMQIPSTVAMLTRLGDPTSTPNQNQTSVAPSFMPTSVIKKMASEKAEEKERQQANSSPEQKPGMGSPERPPPVLKIVQPDAEEGEETSELTEEQRRFIEQAGLIMQQREQMMKAAHVHAHTGVDTPPLVAPDGSITIPVPQTPQTPATPQTPQSAGSYPQINMTDLEMIQQMLNKPRPLMGQGTMNVSLLSQASSNMSSLVNSSLGGSPQTPQTPQTQGSAIGRPIVKGPNQGVMSPPTGQRALTGMKSEGGLMPNQQSSNAQGQRALMGGNPGLTIDINKVMEHQRQMNAAAAAARPMPPASPNLPRSAGLGMPMNQRLPGTPVTPVAPVRPAVTANPNALLMQRMMQQNLNSPQTQNRGPVPGQMNQLNTLAALQAVQAQGRGIDPRVQGVRPVYPGMPANTLNPGLATGTNPRPNFGNTLNAAVFNAAISRALSPQPQINPAMVTLAATQDGMNGPLSPGGLNRAVSPNPMAALLGGRGAGNNLAKWFGNDVLKQQMPNMPPLPTQGQKVMTVDEIERRQQTVTH